MRKTIAVVNQKGGVGKTTTTVNLATALSAVGKKVLIIDFDPQGNATTGLGKVNKKEIVGTYESLIGKVDFHNAYQETSIPNLYLMPASVNLSGAEIELVNVKGREKLLSQLLKNRLEVFQTKLFLKNYLR